MTTTVRQPRVRYRSFHYTGETLDEMTAALSFYFRTAEMLYWWVDARGYLQISANPAGGGASQGTMDAAAKAAKFWVDNLDRLAKSRLNRGIPNDGSPFTELVGFGLSSSYRRYHEDPDTLQVCPEWV